MLHCHNLWDLEEQRGKGFLNLSYEGKGKSHKQEKLLWCKKIYALHSKNSENWIYSNKNTEIISFDSKYFFSAESRIYHWQSRRFSFWTPLKMRVKRQEQPLELFCKKGALKNFVNFTGKHLCWRTPILKKICERLLLKPVQVSPGLPFFDNLHFWFKLVDML